MGRLPGTCEVCGADFHRINSLRKYCTTCQIIRDTEFMPGLSAECDWCHSKFYPVRATYKRCNKCREATEWPDRYPACTGCKRHNRPAPELDGWCMSCVQENPKRRDQYVRTITKKRDARKAEWIAAGKPRHERVPKRGPTPIDPEYEGDLF